MAAEYLEVDKHGLYLLAELHQRRWTTSDGVEVRMLAAEIRQQETRFGLTPIDRRRLQWEVDNESAQERTQMRRQRRRPVAGDPRDVFKLIE